MSALNRIKHKWKVLVIGIVIVIVIAGVSFVGGGILLGNGTSPNVATQKEKEPSKEVFYSCSMCPQVRQPEPGLCPICGMDLIPVAEGEGSADTPATQVAISERAKILSKINTTLVRRKDEPGVDLHLLGRIEPKESNLKAVTAWTTGRIDRLHVNKTGQKIGRGRVVATIYSPEIYAAHQDLLLAKKQMERITGDAASVQLSARSALDSIRERLQLLGVPDGDIDRMEKANSPWRQVPIRSPFAGTVLERLVTEGAYVAVGTPLYQVANLSTIWVQLDAYESDLSRLDTKQPVELQAEAYPDEIFDGVVSFIDPTLDPVRRTAKVRVEVKNIGGRLRPGMFVEATVKGNLSDNDVERPLMIPRSAPLFTGRRSVVYVEVPDIGRPTYEARLVRLGPLTGDHYPVIAGLRSGERVVTKGAFALDADLQIRGGNSMMSFPDDTETGIWDQVVQLSEKQLKTLKPLYNAYFAIQLHLAGDNVQEASEDARKLIKVLEKTNISEPTQAATVFAQIAKSIKESATTLKDADNIAVARSDFELISRQFEHLLVVFGNPLDESVHQAYCPMAFNNRGATWIQKNQDIANAYFGASMLKCGEIRSTIDSGGFLADKPNNEEKNGGRPSGKAVNHGGHQH